MILHKTISIAFILLIADLTVDAQSPVFYHLSTAEGLSDNNVNSARMDKNGILWVATTEGLNRFDGNRITTFHKYNFPAIADNNIDDIIADNQNNLWLKTSTPNITMLDENRNFRLFSVGDSSSKKNVSELFATSIGMIAIKANQQFLCANIAEAAFKKMDFPLKDILPSPIRFITNFSDDKVIFYGDARLLVIDYKTMKLLIDLPIKNIIGAAAINSNDLLAYTIEGNVFYRISIPQKKIIKEYRNLLDQYQKPMEGNLRNIARIDSMRFAFTSRFSGLYYLDIQKEKLEHYTHDALDQRSIGGNNTYRISYNNNGYLLVTTQTSGLHYYNTKQQQAASKSYFINDKSEIFDGYIQAITTTKDSTVFMGAQDRLIRWDRKADKTNYIPCFLPDGKNISKEETIRALYFDENDNLWVGTTRFGILILNKQFKTIAQITNQTDGSKTTINSGWINAICRDNKGNHWVATIKGISIIEKGSLKVQSIKDHPILSPLNKINCIELWVDSKNRIWMGSRSGVFCYDQTNNTLKHYTTKDGLAHNAVHTIIEDNYGTLYFGTDGGLSVLSKDETIKSYNRNNGLKNDKCEGILKDEKGFLWIGNLNCILRYDPVNRTFAVFEEGYGFSHSGFRMRCCFKSETGEMFWGTDKGLTWFYPDQMSSVSTKLNPSINTIHASNITYRLTGKSSLNFGYNTSTFVIQFASGEITGEKKIQYLYRLYGFNDDWKTPVAAAQVTFNNLPSGTYRFEIKASRDGLNWYNGAYPIEIIIAKPWWQQFWFRIIYILTGIALIYAFYYYYKKRKQAKEVNQLIEYFNNAGYEQSSVEDILRDISRNIILRMGFENCAIFLYDDANKMLIKKSVQNRKNIKSAELLTPTTPPFHSGLVDNVFVSGIGCIMIGSITRKRNTVNSENRLSEICVPILHEGKPIGIIHSDNEKRNFFNSTQLENLQAIALACSGKIVHAITLEAMNESKLKVMELNVKIAESKFLNLRLQMNPHFLFNSLSSIQVLIVSKQTTEAYKYLTLFSNFLRSLLNYAEKNFMPLDEELKVLKMYIELESLRFDKTFAYEINVDETLANDEVLVPSLMVQPFVENAIWHGLLHKEGEKKLSINFHNHKDKYLICTIKDNGVGRAVSESIQKNKIKSITHNSKGISIIKERLSLLQQKTGKPAHVAVTDLYNQNSESTGTKVIITIPYYNPDES